MIVSKTTILLLMIVLLMSIFLSSVNNAIKYERPYNESFMPFTWAGDAKNVKNIGTDSDDLIWFIQISDLHLSIFRDPLRISQFEDFCLKTVEAVKPLVVLASGDLTDAKERNNVGSAQHIGEWEHYHRILKKTNVTAMTTWLDLRGNHDNFNVAGLHSSFNYFRKYSIQGLDNPESYLHIAKKGNKSVAFLGVDACPEPGLRRPFNFIGILNPTQQKHVKNLLAEANEKASSIIWFSHYPSSCILWISNHTNRKENLRDVIGSSPNSLAHLAGHLHLMGGIVQKMYTQQRPGYLELELGDWKDNRMFRLGAIDHGIFSFADQQHNVWPLILITNPKHAAYTMPGREPVYLTQTSTHIRLLVFSLAEIIAVEVRIVGYNNREWIVCLNANGPLYVCKWSPENIPSGVQTIEAKAVDSLGRERIISQPFSTDGSKVHFSILPRIILMIDAHLIFQYTFATILLLITVPLCYLRLIDTVPTGSWRRLRMIWMLSKIKRLYYPLILYPVYLTFGPWSIGDLIEGHTGVIFAWGIFINGTFIPGSFTYLYGSLQLLIIHVPLIFILSKHVERRIRYQWICSRNRSVGEQDGISWHKSKWKLFLFHSSFIFVLSMQMLSAYFFWLEYGTLAFFIGPMKTWPIMLSIALWYQTLTLPLAATRDVMKLCYPMIPP